MEAAELFEARDSKSKEDSPMIAFGEIRKPAENDEISAKTKCSSRIWSQLFFIQWTFTLASSILAYFYIGDLVQSIVNESLVISTKSDKYYLWEEPPVNPELSIYIFNITNSKEWMTGSEKKLRVKQVGPYVYKEYWKKINITFHAQNSSVTYRTVKKFQFLPEKSFNEDDILVLPNIPLFSAGSSLKNADSFTLLGFRTALSLLDEHSKEVFIHKTAKEIIWGYDDQLSSLASFVLPPEELGIPGKFGLFAGKNMTEGDWITVDTGEKSLRKLSQVLTFRGKDHFKAWSTDSCNQVQGSDGSYYPPWIHSTDTVSLFVPEMCSAIRLASDGQEVLYGQSQITALRFRPHDNMFNYDLPENQCFCSAGSSSSQSNVQSDDTSDWFNMFSLSKWFADQPEPEKVQKPKLSCPSRGVLDLGPCKFDAPLSVSWPHFYKGEEKLRSDVDGLDEPTEEAHGFYLDIQPTMGIAMNAKVRMQMNLKIEKSNLFSSLPLDEGQKLLLPIMWFEDMVDSPPHDLLEMIAEALMVGPNVARKSIIFSLLFLVTQLSIYAAYNIWKAKTAKTKTSADRLKTTFGCKEKLCRLFKSGVHDQSGFSLPRNFFSALNQIPDRQDSGGTVYF